MGGVNNGVALGMPEYVCEHLYSNSVRDRSYCDIQFKTKEGAAAKVSTGVCPRHKNLSEDAGFWMMFYQLWWEHGHGQRNVTDDTGRICCVNGHGLPNTHNKDYWDCVVS